VGTSRGGWISGRRAVKRTSAEKRLGRGVPKTRVAGEGEKNGYSFGVSASLYGVRKAWGGRIKTPLMGLVEGEVVFVRGGLGKTR